MNNLRTLFIRKILSEQMEAEYIQIFDHLAKNSARIFKEVDKVINIAPTFFE